MAYKFSKGKRGMGDIEFEDDAVTGIDFEPDTIKLETGGQERVVVNNTEASFSVPIRATSIEYTDGDDAITIDDGGYLKFNSGVKYSRGVRVSSGLSPAGNSNPNKDGGWIKFASVVRSTVGSNLDTTASSFLVTIAGFESSTNRRLNGTFLVHAKYTNNNNIGHRGHIVSHSDISNARQGLYVGSE